MLVYCDSADWKTGESEEKLFLREQQVSYINLIRKKQEKKDRRGGILNLLHDLLTNGALISRRNIEISFLQYLPRTRSFHRIGREQIDPFPTGISSFVLLLETHP